MIHARVQAEDIDLAAELARLEGLGGGAVASFTGIVRAEEALAALRLEHHPGMTGAALRDIAGTAAARWPLLGVVLVHRHGLLRPGERIVLAAVAAPHRAAAFDACAFLIDWAKTRAPFWKQELRADGTTRWIEARVEDDAAAAGWDISMN